MTTITRPYGCRPRTGLGPGLPVARRKEHVTPRPAAAVVAAERWVTGENENRVGSITTGPSMACRGKSNGADGAYEVI